MKHSFQITTAILISAFVSTACRAGTSDVIEIAEVSPPRAAAVKPLAAVSKDEAWARWYQPPEKCGINVSKADFVPCVNHKMLARKEFERVWQRRMN